MQTCQPSIEFLELYALCLAVFTWDYRLTNCRVMLYCDNKSIWDMVNSTTSSCMHCMKLIRLLTLNCLWYNRKLHIQYIESHKNVLADALSRGKFKTFWKHAPSNTQHFPDRLPEKIWPVAKFWKWY